MRYVQIIGENYVKLKLDRCVRRLRKRWGRTAHIKQNIKYLYSVNSWGDILVVNGKKIMLTNQGGSI